MKQITLGVLVLLLLFCTAHSATQSIGLNGVGNARELGGYSAPGGHHVKHGVLLRTAALSGATSDDIHRLLDVYHLSAVLDFRMTYETDSAPDPEIPGVKNIHLRIINEEASQEIQRKYIAEHGLKPDMSNKLEVLKLAVMSGIINDNMYIRFLSDAQGKEGYRRMFQELLALPEGKSLLFHCTQGKDRTGLAAMLILSVLGVDEDTIMADFMLTNTFNAELIERERQMLIQQGYEGEELDRYMKVMDEVDPQYMINVLEWIKENYSSVTGYITKELGITQEQLDILRGKFLD